MGGVDLLRRVHALALRRRCGTKPLYRSRRISQRPRHVPGRPRRGRRWILHWRIHGETAVNKVSTSQGLEVSLEERIAAAERAAASLDPDGAGRAAIRDPVLAYAEWFLDELPRLPAYNVTEEKGRAIRDVHFTEEGRPVEEVLELFAEHVDGPGLNPASGGHLGYVPGGGLYASSLADYLSDVTNRYAGVFFSSPGAVRVEHQVMRWTADVVGFPASAGGTLTSGG